jgi:hypothetical protein
MRQAPALMGRMLCAPALVALVAVMALIATMASSDERFIAGLEDLPLMAGLHEVREVTIVFDKPDGRIVEATALGAVTVGEVQRFYLTTLPELGWVTAGDLRFVREGETLVLTLTEGDEGVRVRYSIAPKHGDDG